MRITQRLFVEALTKLLMSDLTVSIHCPGTLIAGPRSVEEAENFCKVCQLVCEKYLGYDGKIDGNCPCAHIYNFKPGDIYGSDGEFLEDYVRFEATRVVEGWNNDHPSQVRLTNGGGDE